MDIAARIAVQKVLMGGAVEIRDVDGGEKPFLYTSGDFGPGYVSIKGLVGQKSVMKFLVGRLAVRVANDVSGINFIAGNANGGIVPGWLLSDYLGLRWLQQVPFVYVRGERRGVGREELITGIAHNQEISSGDNGLIVEDTVNFGTTTRASALTLRDAGFIVTHAACILSWENPVGMKALAESGISLIYLFTIQDLLSMAEGLQLFSPRAIADCREFLNDPLGWQKRRGFEPVRETGTR